MDELRRQILRDLLGEANINLSEDQDEAVTEFVRFMDSQDFRATFLLTGSAGTGKTFLINLFTTMLRKSGYKVILLAPTGRAAKVITRRTKRPAYTIHHHIYAPMEGQAGQVSFSMKGNKAENKTVYIVDEASMIGDKSDGSTPNSLLADLLRYVFFEDEYRKLVLVGDPVQLPPVGHELSPALDADQLFMKHSLNVFHAHLTDVKRQLSDSGVLENAVAIRDAYLSQGEVLLHLEPSRDVMQLESPYEALETYISYYEEGNLDKVVFLTYSNFQSTRVNQGIRHHLFYTEDLLVHNELLMVVRNNYSWGDPKRLPFIANGEMGIVRDIFPETYEEKYGQKWMDVCLEFQDTKGESLMIDCKILLSLLTEKHPQLSNEASYSIFMERQKEYLGMPKGKAAELLRKDPYINALQVKYGYSVTGHKSQGGQWENVIIGFEPDYGNNALSYLRWTYTAFTRAEERVFTLNCPFWEE
ncbi:MAG: AAA family ATPase [Bacteroidia bacterium]|nr:AAA family ATPase [Bacteroidia bacterium]